MFSSSASLGKARSRKAISSARAEILLCISIKAEESREQPKLSGAVAPWSCAAPQPWGRLEWAEEGLPSHRESGSSPGAGVLALCWLLEPEGS